MNRKNHEIKITGKIYSKYLVKGGIQDMLKEELAKLGMSDIKVEFQ